MSDLTLFDFISNSTIHSVIGVEARETKAVLKDVLSHREGKFGVIIYSIVIENEFGDLIFEVDFNELEARNSIIEENGSLNIKGREIMLFKVVD